MEGAPSRLTLLQIKAAANRRARSTSAIKDAQTAPSADLAQRFELCQERHNASLAGRMVGEMSRESIEKPRICE